MKIDAHHHFWKRDEGFYDWLTPDLGAIYRDFAPEDLESSLFESGVISTVLIQAAASIEETKLLLSLAEKTAFVKAVIGWVDLESDDFVRDLRLLMQHSLFKGIRPMVQDLEDPNWLTKPALEPAFEFLSSTGLVFEALVRPPQWAALLEFAGRYTDLPIIVDHGAKPAIRNGLNGAGGFSEWAGVIDRLAANEHVVCKLSGLLTEAVPGAALEDIRPYMDHLYDRFGPDRLMWGSDWPVLLMEADYLSWMHMAETWLQGKSANDAVKIFSANAARLYSISDACTKTASQVLEAKTW